MGTKLQCVLLPAMAACLLPLATPAQWTGVGQPFVGAPNVVYADTVHDWLIAAGKNNVYYDSEHAYFPVFRYHAEQWDTLGLFSSEVKTAVVYHDTLVVGGGFRWMRNDTISALACYVNGQWQPYGAIEEASGVPHGVIMNLRVVDGELYALGVFKYADGQYANGLAKRVGGHWEPVPGWSELDIFGEAWLRDIVSYQGKLVVGGNFSFTQGWWKDLLQYDGTTWVPICDHCLLGGYDGLAALAVYKGELYVGGMFKYGTGNAGQGIMRWDGQTWRPLGPVGAGIQADNYSDFYTPDIGCLNVHDGLLYISGGYKAVNHMPVPAGICTWDGTNFCIPQGTYFSYYLMPMDFYHGTLYGGTGSDALPQLEGLVYYTGEFDQCSALGVREDAGGAPAFRAQWLGPGAFVLHGLPDGRHDVQVFDAQGRMVLATQVGSAQGQSGAVALERVGMALYTVVADHARTARIIPTY